MYELKVQTSFEAAHRVVGYDGKCNNLHGHSWTVEVTAQGNELDDLGMLADFKKVKGALNEILDSFDHHFLNEMPDFLNQNPTAENISRVIYDKMKTHPVFTGKAELKSVIVWESPHSSITYRED